MPINLSNKCDPLYNSALLDNLHFLRCSLIFLKYSNIVMSKVNTQFFPFLGTVSTYPDIYCIKADQDKYTSFIYFTDVIYWVFKFILLIFFSFLIIHLIPITQYIYIYINKYINK